MRFLLGGYTADMDGNATGIGLLGAGGADDALAGGPLGFGGDAAATAGSPSWVTRHPSLDVVYAALEGHGTVQAFRRTGEASYAPWGAPIAAGEAVCHVAVAPDGASLLASCWGDGALVRMTLDAAGRAAAPSIAPPATDPYAADGGATGAGLGSVAEEPDPAGEEAAIDLAAATRALREAAGAEFAHLVPAHDAPSDVPLFGEAVDLAAGSSDADAAPRTSRGHQAVYLPDGFVATTDLGLDQVRLWRVAGAGLRFAQRVVLPRGSGPRHMVWHPSGHLFVVTEGSNEVFVLAHDPRGDGGRGAWRIVSGAPLGRGVADGDASAEICLSRDGAFVYAGVRGSDTIATLAVREGGAALQAVALVEAGVRWPRHHVVVRDTLLVAGQLGDEVASLTLDVRTGVPTGIRHRTAAPSPTCLVPLP